MKKKSFWKTFFTFLATGVVGVILLIPSILPFLKNQLETLPNPPDLPFAAIVLVSLINPVILLVAAIIIGQLTAPKTGLVSYLYLWTNGRLGKPEKATFRKNVPTGIIWGVAVSLILAGSDLLFQPYLPEGLQAGQTERDIWTTLTAVFYGGVTEEIMMRWGLMSLVAWLLWKIFQRKHDSPSAFIFWISIFISGLLFALGHIGATAIAAPLTAVVLIRMMLLNSIGGIVFGWLFWKKGLEIAMVSHVFTHITTTVLYVLGIF